MDAPGEGLGRFLPKKFTVCQNKRLQNTLTADKTYDILTITSLHCITLFKAPDNSTN